MTSTKTSTKGRTLYCRKCDGHGKLSILKAHNTKCPYLFCECKNCQKLDKKRRNSFQKRNHRQIEAAEKLTKLRQHILQLRADLKDDPDAEVLIAELQKQKIDFSFHYKANGKIPEREIFKQRRRCRSCDITKRAKMVTENEIKFNNDSFIMNNNNQLVNNRATSSSPYSSSARPYSADINSTASSPSSKNSSLTAPFDLWLEKEYQRRQHKKKMEAMRTYTTTAQITTSSANITSTHASATNAVTTNPLLSHALNTAGISKHSIDATTSTTNHESFINRKRSAENEIIQIDDEQPTPRRHCSNNVVKSPITFTKPLTALTPSIVTTPSTTPSYFNSKLQSIPLEVTAPPAIVEGHHYVTLPTIPPISILVPNDTKFVGKFDGIVKPNPIKFNPSTQQLNETPTSMQQEVSAGFIPTTKAVSTSVPNQSLLVGLRQQKPQDSQSFSNAFLSHSLAQSQLNPPSTNSPMTQQNLNSDLNFNANNNLNSNQLLNIIPPPQWIQLIQQPQPHHSQKQNLLPQQIQAAPQIFAQTFSPLQKPQPFPPTITNQPQLRFSAQPLPPPSNSADLSTFLNQNNSLNVARNGNLSQSNSTTPALPVSTTMPILSQPQQNDVKSDSNISCNNLINFANYTFPIFHSSQSPFIVQTQQQKQQLQNVAIPQKPEQRQQTSAEQENEQQQNITSMNLLEHIQQQQRLAIVTSSANQQIQLSSLQTPSTQSNSPALSSSSIAKLNFSLEHQPFAQYLLNLPSISPSGSISVTTPQLPSIGQSPTNVSTEKNPPNISEQSFASKMLSQFDSSNLKHSSTDEIASSFIDGDGGNISNMTVGSTVDQTYLNQLQSTMILLSSTGGQQMVK